MFNPLKSIFGTKHERDVKAMRPLIAQINSLEEQMQKLSDEERDEFYARMLEVAPEMSATERAALDAEIERSLDQVDAGRFVDAADVIAKLRARSA